MQAIGLDGQTLSGRASEVNSRIAALERSLEDSVDRAGRNSDGIRALEERVTTNERASDAVTYRLEEQRNSSAQLNRAIENLSTEFKQVVKTVTVLDERMQTMLGRISGNGER